MQSLKTNSGALIDYGRIAIFVSKDKSGFSTSSQIKEVCGFVRNFGFVPILLAFSEEEELICLRSEETFLVAKDKETQALFYDKFCFGVIGGNSNYDLPVSFGLPLFVFVKLSIGQKTKIFDEIVDPPMPISISNFYDRAETWIRTIGKELLANRPIRN